MVVVAAPAVGGPGWRDVVASAVPQAPHLVMDWRPGGSAAGLAGVAASLDGVVTGPVESAVCTHPGGPPTCWCRPPLPGLAVAFARRHGAALSGVVVVGSSAAHRALSEALGGRFLAV